jgi:hypothetical protein
MFKILLIDSKKGILKKGTTISEVQIVNPMDFLNEQLEVL